MRVLRNIFIFLLILFLTAAGFIFYAFKIEPFRILVNEYTLNEEKEGMSEIKMVQISDLHIKEDFTYENLGRVINKINGQNPDIVLFTGDLYDNYAKYHDDENIISELRSIEARYEKIAVWGNRDCGGGASRNYREIMESAGFKLLKNENLYVELENGRRILFTGLDDSLLGNPTMPESTKLYQSDYEVLLMHEPDTVKDFVNYDYDIVLSGHSHGGQVNIPFLPGLNKKLVESTLLSTEYSGGMYQVNENTGKKLYVNTGIGTTHISARFGVVPEVAVFYIYI